MHTVWNGFMRNVSEQKKVTEKYTMSGSCINSQLHYDWIMYQAASQNYGVTLGHVNWGVVNPDLAAKSPSPSIIE